MRVVMSSSPDLSENFLIFHITYDSCEVNIEVWLSGSEPTINGRSALVQQLKREGVCKTIDVGFKMMRQGMWSRV